MFRFGIGGLENGVVNLINGLPAGNYRHEIICLKDYDESFAERIVTGNFRLYALNKREGNDFAMWGRAFALLRRLRPDILHTRNFGALEIQLAGAAAGIDYRIHGEHGWDMLDLDGNNRRYRLVRRVVGYGVHRFISLSKHLEHYLVERVHIPARKISQVYNGVDEQRFHPPAKNGGNGPVIVETVGRMQAVKNQTLLARAFVSAVRREPALSSRVNLHFVGAGPLLEACHSIIHEAGLDEYVLFLGESDRVPEALRRMDIFVLPSLAEGISNTLLEAMATGLPVIATRVGGNVELVEDGVSGRLVEPDDMDAMAAAIAGYARDESTRKAHGERERTLVETRFGLGAMIAAYDRIYRPDDSRAT